MVESLQGMCEMKTSLTPNSENNFEWLTCRPLQTAKQ